MLKPLLEVVPGVISVTTDLDVAGEPRGDRRHSLTVTIAPNQEPGRDLASIILSAGIGLYEMRRIRPTLEDVFLELLQQDETAPQMLEDRYDPTQISFSAPWFPPNHRQ
jgi:ABC-2 type transport system ATP-binding protein